MNVLTEPLHKTFSIIGHYFSTEFDLNRELNQLRKELDVLTVQIESVSLEDLDRSTMPMLLNQIDLLLTLLERFERFISSYPDKDFWAVWHRAKESLKLFYNSLKVALRFEPNEQTKRAMLEAKEGKTKEVKITDLNHISRDVLKVV